MFRDLKNNVNLAKDFTALCSQFASLGMMAHDDMLIRYADMHHGQSRLKTLIFSPGRTILLKWPQLRRLVSRGKQMQVMCLG